MERRWLPITMIGKEDGGKTSICTRFCKGTFSDTTLSTLGSQIFQKTIHVDGTTHELVIWDIGGQDQFREECHMYVKKARVVVIVLAVDDLESFEQLETWMECIKNHAERDPDVLLVASKIDLRCECNACITREQVNTMGKAMECAAVLETSAKTGENISQVFDRCVEVSRARDRVPYEPMSIKEVL